MHSRSPRNVLIAGGGVAALEAALALADLGRDRLAVTVLAPEAEFVVRPMTVQEPFGLAAARRYPVARVVEDADAALVVDGLKWVDAAARAVHLHGGGEIGYDALLLAVGARPYARYPHALTIDDRILDAQLHGLVQDIEGGFVRSLAVVVPPGGVWPLPAYELALQCAARAFDASAELAVTLFTPEERPLQIFGVEASNGVASMLADAGVAMVCSAYCEVPEPGIVRAAPSGWRVEADRVLALPALRGPAVAGVPAGRGGFLRVDPRMRVRGVKGVWAAGDATDFAIKFGGIAAQQADLASASIASGAGLGPEPKPFHPVIQAILVTGGRGGRDKYLSAYVTGGHGSCSYISDAPPATTPAKIASRHLAPYLDLLDRAAVS
jgi:sulfide:quinone oxidoreductase